MRKSYLAILFVATVLMAGNVFGADVNISADVGNDPPTVGLIQLCEGTQCSLIADVDNAIDPASQFTIEVTVTDPNGQSDINTESFRLEWYATSDANGSGDDWDAVTLDPPTLGTRDQCVQTGSIYCLQVDTSDWTTKFIAGLGDVYVYVADNTGEIDSNEAVALFTVNSSYGTVEDTTAGTYAGNPNTTDNAFTSTQTAENSIESANNGNVDINITAQQTDLTSGGDTIGDANISWYSADDAGSSTPFTGGTDLVIGDMNRGNAVAQTSALFNLWMWLDIPQDQPAGTYTGTLTYASVEASP